MNKISLFIIILLILGNFIFCDFDYNKYWYNPNGWELPDLNKFEKVKEEKLNLKDVKGEIVIEYYSIKNKEKCFIFDNKGDKDFVVYLNRKIRYEINSFSIAKLKRRNSEKILLYVIDYFDQEETVQNFNGKIVTLYSGGGLSIGIIMDFNDDGKYELFYSGLTGVELDPMNTIKTLTIYRYKKLMENEKKKADISVTDHK